MAKEKNKGEEGEEQKVEVPMSVLSKMQEDMAKLEQKLADQEATNAGILDIAMKNAEALGEPKLREKKNFEPKFRVVRVRKYPMMGDEENMGYVVGWSNKGAYQVVDRTGVSPQIIDMIDVQFLGQERNEETGKLKFESIKLLDLFNKGIQVHCKILKQEVTPRKEPTGEEIDVTTWDPQHGLVATGDKIDGYTAFSDIMLTIQIPGVEGPTEIDAMYVN